MKGEDIDKLFRDKLSGSVEPTTESDWTAFEASLDKPGGWFSAKYLALTALILIGSFSAAYYFGTFDTDSEITKASETRTESFKSELGQLSQAEPIEENKQNEHSSYQSEIKHETASEESNSVDGFELASTREEVLDDTNSEIIGNSLEAKTKPDQVGIKQNANANQGIAQAEKTNTKTNKVSKESPDTHSNKEEQDEILTKETTENSLNGSSPSAAGTAKREASVSGLSSQGFRSNSGLSASELNLEITEASISELSLMQGLGGLITIEAPLQNLQGNIQGIDSKTTSAFSPFIYVKAEQNLILETSIGLGIGVERRFVNSKNWMRNLGLSLGIGYLRSGALAWEQESERVFYGFDRYQDQSQLSTKSLDLLQVPIHLNYDFGGVHSVFAGVESSFVLNASQDFSALSGTGEGSSTENGYLYDANTPDYIYFFQVGYGYSINERYKIQIGGSLSNQNWKPSSKDALGGFIKLNYKFR